MASIERTAYPRFKSHLTENELTEFYTPTATELELAHKNALGQRPILSFLILLKSFQRLGYFPALRHVPHQIKQHLREYLALPEEQMAGLEISQRSKSLYRYHTAIRAYLDVKLYDETAQLLAANAVTQAAKSKSNPADLINVALEVLVKERYELPAFSTLDHLVQRLRNAVNQEYFEMVLGRLFMADRSRLDAMLKLTASPLPATESSAPTPLTTAPTTTPANPAATETAWVRLKQVPKSASLTHLQELQERYQWLLGLAEVDQLLVGIPPAKVKDFAAHAHPLKASELLLYTPATRYTLMLCLIQQMRLTTRDNLVETFLKRMAFFHSRARAELLELRQHQQATVERLLNVLSEILLLTSQTDPAADPATPASFGQVVWEIVRDRGGAESLLAECEAMAAYNDDNYLPLLHRYYKSHRTTLFRLVKTLKFVATSEDKLVKAALDFLLKHETSTDEYLAIDSLDLSFAEEKWQRLIMVSQGQGGERQLLRRQLEICIFSYLASELKNGDMAVTDSEKFLDYRQQLLSWKECQPLLADYSAEVGLPTEAKAFVAHIRNELTTQINAVERAYADSPQFALDEKGIPSVTKPPTKTYSKNLKTLEPALRDRMPNRNILEILCNVQHYTNFTRHFGPPSGSDSKLDNAVERYLLTTFGYGCNLGPVQLVKHLQNEVSAGQLSFINQRHIDLTRLASARTDIINAYVHFDLPKVWGDGSGVAADGTKVELARNNLISEYHIRYGGYGGIRYHFVSDTYLALFTSFITCGVWEGSYILDIFSQNKSELQPDKVFSDTHGQALPIFALAYLLGIKLTPRIRNFKGLTFFRPDKTNPYQYLAKLFEGVIDWELIERHLPDLLRVALSIKTGKILPSTLLRRLNNYSRKNKLYLAMRELGRAVRTCFLLRWLTEPELRSEVTGNTNKVETYHNFANWFSFGGEGILAENDPVEQEKRNHYLDLVADAAIYQNVVDMSRVLSQLKREGLEFDREDLAALSPYLTRHIRRFGNYVIDLSRLPDPYDGKLDLSQASAEVKIGS